jgi:hypothetical protein
VRAASESTSSVQIVPLQSFPSLPNSQYDAARITNNMRAIWDSCLHRLPHRRRPHLSITAALQVYIFDVAWMAIAIPESLWNQTYERFRCAY